MAQDTAATPNGLSAAPPASAIDPQVAQAGAERAAFIGSFFALGAYGIWGFAPLYFHWIGELGAVQIVAHRVLWSALLLIPLIVFTGGLPRLLAVLRSPSSLGWLALSGTLIGCNWLLFIYGVMAGRVLEISLGYFMNPLVSLVLGMLFFGERLRPVQAIAVAVAVIGVGNEVLRYGDVPWLGLALAFSFGFYGLVRKRLGADAFTGLAVETWLLLPIAVSWLAWNAALGGDLFMASAANAGKLFLAGPITMLPLLCFAAAANRLTLGSLGFFQYVAPSLQFVLAVWVFAEPFEPAQWWTFGLIWTALVLFSATALHDQRRRRIAALRARA